MKHRREDKMENNGRLVLRIENVRGVANETLEFERGCVTEVKRGHGEGKSTIACAIAACLARETDPMGLIKGKGNPYQRRGFQTPIASATLNDTQGAFSIRWEPGKKSVKATGTAPTPVAKLGVWEERTIDEGNAAEQARRWSEAIGLSPIGLDEIEASLVETSTFDANDLDEMVKALNGASDETRDATYDEWQVEAWTRTKIHEDEFVKITREAGNPIGRYGIEKARKWHPEGWTEEIKKTTKESLEEEERAKTATLEHERKTLECYLAERGATAKTEREVEDTEQRLRVLRTEETETRTKIGSKEEDREQRIARETETEHETARQENERASQALANARNRGRAALASVEEHENGLRTIEKRRAQAEQARDALESASTQGDTCPTCLQVWETAKEKREKRVKECRETLESINEPTPGEIEKSKNELEAARTRAEEVKKEIAETLKRSDETQSKERRTRETARVAREGNNNEAENALERALGMTLGKIENLEAQKTRLLSGAKAPDDDLIQASTQGVKQAEEDIETTRRKKKITRLEERARTEHTKTCEWTRIAKELGPENGLRARARERALEGLQGWIERVRHLSDMKEVRVCDGDITWNGLPIGIASSTERWIARTIVRIAICTRSRAPACVVDGADRWVPEWRMRMRNACERIAKKTGMAIVWTEAA